MFRIFYFSNKIKNYVVRLLQTTLILLLKCHILVKKDLFDKICLKVFILELFITETFFLDICFSVVSTTVLIIHKTFYNISKNNLKTYTVHLLKEYFVNLKQDVRQKLLIFK